MNQHLSKHLSCQCPSFPNISIVLLSLQQLRRCFLSIQSAKTSIYRYQKAEIDRQEENTDETQGSIEVIIGASGCIYPLQFRVYLVKTIVMKDEEFSYFLARLPIGMSFLCQGLVRLPKLDAVSRRVADSFSPTILPESLVRPFAYILPLLAALIGILLLIGLFTRFSLVLGVIVTLLLIIGLSLLQLWDIVFIQVIYGVYFAILYRYLYLNRVSLDRSF